MNERPLASIIIVTFNAKEFVTACIDQILINNYKNFEIIVTDNGSNDDTTEYLKNKFGNLTNFKLIPLEKNYGPSLARNKAIEHAEGKYLAILDADTLPDKNWLIALVNKFESNPRLGAVQCKLLLARERDKYDYGGEYLSPFGFLIQRVPELAKDTGQFDQEDRILAAKSAAMGLRRDVYDKIGGFDDDYFIYVEETDLGWRVWLAGYEVRFLPESIVYHEYGTTNVLNPKLGTHNLKFHGTKNYIATLYKNLETKNLLKILPIHVAMWLGMSLILFIKGQFLESRLILKGVFWNIKNLKKLKAKRDKIQRERVVKDSELFEIVMKRKPLIYFLKKFFAPQEVQHRNQANPCD